MPLDSVRSELDFCGPYIYDHICVPVYHVSPLSGSEAAKSSPFIFPWSTTTHSLLTIVSLAGLGHQVKRPTRRGDNSALCRVTPDTRADLDSWV